MVDLRQDCVQIEQIWIRSRDSWMPLSLAAAFTFHQTRRDGAHLLFPEEYANALDIAAAALSRLIPIYMPDERGVPVAVPINLASQKFCAAATKVQCADGTVLSPLDIVRQDLIPAIVAVERAKIDYVAPGRVK